MKFLPESFNNLRCEFGIERIHLARLTRRKVDDQERNHRDEEEGDHFLDDASADKRKHKKYLKCTKVPKIGKHKNRIQKTVDRIQNQENGVLESWIDGVWALNQYSSTPMLHYSKLLNTTDK